MSVIEGTSEALERRRALKESRLERLRRMVEIRLVEDRIIESFGEGLIAGSTHTCQGQEAVSVAIAAVLQPTDTVACTYRGHGMALALGMTREALLGEVFGRRIGCMGGLGGSMHLSDPTVGLLPTFAIVGAGVPIGVGAALAAQVKGSGNISVSVFGDGATNIGAFHEGLNLAAIWSLPTVFICENNLYGEYSPLAKTTPVTDIAVRAASYGMEGAIVDGQNLDALEEVIGAAAVRAREGGGPTLIEAKTYRYAGHSRSDKGAYRPSGELEAWLQRDPITLYARKLVEEGSADQGTLDAMREETGRQLDESIETVLASPVPDPSAMLANITAGRKRK